MGFAALEYPPVITPRLLEAVNGRLAVAAREELLSVLRASIVDCFRPFAVGTGRGVDAAFSEAAERFLPYRLWFSHRLVSLLGERALGELTETLPRLLEPGQRVACERLGIRSDVLGRCLAKYVRNVRNVLVHGAWASIDPKVPSIRRILGNLLGPATELDFGLTLIFLALENEVDLGPLRAGFALAATGRALTAYEHHLDRLLKSATRLPEEARVARTELGARLLELRAEILKEGLPALDWNGLQAELAERRGGVGDGE